MLPGSERAADGLARGALAHASWLSYGIQSGGHPRFLSVMLIATMAAMVGGLYWGGGSLPTQIPPLGPDLGMAWIPALVVGVAAILTAVVPDRVPKIIMMAVAGYGMAVFYVMFRAPDLALTQLLVETVSLLLLLLVFRGIPKPARAGCRAIAGRIWGLRW
jgi:multicomponent K+:H+ antiporter subunit A